MPRDWSTSTPAARSFTSALCAAPASWADCHSRSASPTAAASSPVRVISGSSYSARAIR
jgi:hypothetical protein